MKVAEAKTSARAPHLQKKGAESTWSSSYTHPFLPIQTKLTIGKPGDKYEQEADAMADYVVGRMNSSEIAENTDSPTASSASTSLMRKPIFESDADHIQPKIAKATPSPNEAVNTPEQETESEKTEEEETRVMRKPIFESDTPPDESPIQRSQGNPEAGSTPSLESRINSSKGGGTALPSNTQSQMEGAFGADFSGVRVHNDTSAVQMNQELGAQAFTHGNDIYFNRGTYNPGSTEGDRLLAHELTHTVQQGASIQLKPIISSANGVNVQANVKGLIARFVDKNVPGYSLLSVVIGYDLIRGKSVSRSRDNILKGVFSIFNPLGSRMHKLLKQQGIVEQAFKWIDAQLEELGLSYAVLKRKFDEFWEEADFKRIWDLAEYNTNLFKRKFGPYVNKITTFVNRAKDQVFKFLKDAFLNVLVGLAKKLEGYDLLADLLGYDPVTKEERNATTADILRGVLKLPVIQALGGDKLLKKLDEHKLIDKAAVWIDAQWALLKGGFKDLKNIATKFLNGFSLETLKAPMDFVNGIKGDILGFVSKVFSFFKSLAKEVLSLIKDVSVLLLKSFIDESTPGYSLVSVILGKDPLTDKKVPRTAENIIKGFLELLPGGKEVFTKLKETGAIDRTKQWILGAIQTFIKILAGFKASFIELWQTSTIGDLFKPIPFFKKILTLFKTPVLRLIAFVKQVMMKIFEVLLQIMKFPVKIAKNIISNIQKAFTSIKKDPIGFLLNMLKAVKEGFQKFFDNIGKHLLAGVSGWLFGQVAKAGITPPKDLSLKSILGLVMDILGLQAEKLWQLLAKRIGQEKVDKIRGAVDKLTGVWLFVKDVMTNGISAVWKFIQEKISNLWNMVVEEVKSWVLTKIIEKVATKLLSMLDPTGIMAVVNGFMAFFNAIQSALEYFQQMLEIVNTFTGGIAEIAKGAVSKATKFLENALSKALPVALGFLANQVGLGNIGDKLKEIIGKVKAFIEKGLNWLIDKAVKGMKSIMSVFTGGGKSKDGKKNQGGYDAN
ncbi:MAG: DUF4157 domain-containing protein, partial [Bacteroidota bacterium]